MLDLAVVGGGAAGLMAAIAAGRQSRSTGADGRIVVLDGAPRIGAKILIAGGGRCNVTNEDVSADDFNGTNRHLISRVLRGFDVAATVEFFREIGVPLKREEGGKLFPVTDRARTVLDALLGAVRDAGAEVRTAARVLDIRRESDRFVLSLPAERLSARRVILATGGRSVPKTGSDGAGYEIARSLGHSVIEPFPALVPLLLPKGHWLTALTGVSCESELRVSCGKEIMARRRGSMLMTHFGLSGPAVLDISRHWIAARHSSPEAALEASLVPASYEEVEKRLLAAREGRATVGSSLRGWLPDRLADALCLSAAGLDPGRQMNHLTREERRRLVRALVSLDLPVIGDRGFGYAEVTAGGVPLTEVDPATMSSRRCPGLFLCGEILDVDGRIGGFNFQWAWASGRLAGVHSVKGLAV